MHPDFPALDSASSYLQSPQYTTWPGAGAVAAISCNRTVVTYEAQAAIALEACCDPRPGVGAYPFALTQSECLQIDAGPLFVALTDDILRTSHQAL